MTINAVELMKFLGHSSIHESFDDYLHQHGIKKRPDVAGKHYDPYIEVKKQGLHLVFLTSNELREEGVQAKSDGTYLFNWLDIYLKKSNGISPYAGPLPFGIAADFSQEQVRALLGQPKHVNAKPELGTNVDFFFVDDMVVAVKYTDMQGNAIRVINPRLPDNWAREQGIAPAL